MVDGNVQRVERVLLAVWVWQYLASSLCAVAARSKRSHRSSQNAGVLRIASLSWQWAMMWIFYSRGTWRMTGCGVGTL